MFKEFYWGTGWEDIFYMGSSSASYSFGTLYDHSGLFVLNHAYLWLTCILYGTYSPTVNQDTVWTQINTEDSSGGEASALYYAELDDCGLEMGCGSGGEGEGGSGGGAGEGGGSGSGTCYYYVAADENGIPLLDDAGEWIVLAFLGCN